MKAVVLLLALIGLGAARPQFGTFQQAQNKFQQAFRPSIQPFQQPIQQAVRTIQAGPIAYIVRYDANLGVPTGFSYVVAQSDGINEAVIGEVKNEGTDEESLAVEGQYSYVGDDGKTYAVHYTADENGFQPSGEHIPPAASTSRKLGVPSAALASLAGGGLG